MDILISGASVAGPTAAYWLAKAGHRVTVLERGDRLRTAGQNVDVRGPGREVLRRMDLEEKILARGTGEVGLRFVDDDGGVLAEFPAGDDDSSGATAQVEILRGTLAKTLVEAAGVGVEYVFGDQIERIDQDADGATITTIGGCTRRVDVVILAEGSRSRMRDQVFDDVTFRELGLYVAYGTISRESRDDDWWTWFNAAGGRTITLRPDNLGTMRAALSFLSTDGDLQDWGDERIRSAIEAKYADVGWQASRIRAALANTEEFYLDYLTQVKAPSWRRDRIFLCGDAAWCSTPLSGMGTTLAVTGGYVLAGELSSARSLSDAAAGYERYMRPLVDAAQKLPPGTPRLAHPRSAIGVSVMRGILRVAGSRPARAVAARFSSSDSDSDELPIYRTLAS